MAGDFDLSDGDWEEDVDPTPEPAYFVCAECGCEVSGVNLVTLTCLECGGYNTASPIYPPESAT